MRFNNYADDDNSPRSDGEVRDCIEIRSQHLLIAEHLVAESVQSVQRDAYVGGGHPLLQHKQYT